MYKKRVSAILSVAKFQQSYFWFENMVSFPKITKPNQYEA